LLHQIATLPCIGRDDIRDELRDSIMENKKPVAVTVITGNGGIGKTRLAEELCEDLKQCGWKTGFAWDTKKFREEFFCNLKLSDWKPDKDTLIVVDNAASLTDSLKECIETLFVKPRPLTPKLHILLLERHGQERDVWLTKIQKNTGNHCRFGRIKLSDYPLIYEMCARLYIYVLTKLGAKSVPDEVALADHMRKKNWCTEPLFLIAAAIRWRGQMKVAMQPSIREIVQYLAGKVSGAINDSMESWLTEHKHGESTHWGSKKLANHLAVCLTLIRGVEEPHVGKFHVFADGEKTRKELEFGRSCGVNDCIEVLGNLLNPDARGDRGTQLGFVQPDTIGEVYVMNALHGQPELVSRCHNNEWLYSTKVGDTLIRMHQNPALDAKELKEVERYSDFLLDSQRSSYPRLARGARYLHSPQESRQAWLLECLWNLNYQIDPDDMSLLEFSVKAAGQLVAALREAPGRREELATALQHWGNRLYAREKYKDALDATREAVEIHRALAKKNPEKFRPVLADSLINLGADCSDCDKHEDAEEASREAVRLYEELEKGSPGTYRFGLAKSLNGLGRTLRRLGDHRKNSREYFIKARDAFAKSVELRIELVKENVDIRRKGLAKSLANLIANIQAYHASEYWQGLAKSLHNQGTALLSLGDYTRATKAFYKALKIRRVLAENDPALEPDRVESHDSWVMGILLCHGCRHDRRRWAWVDQDQGIKLYNDLVARGKKPGVSEPKLAKSFYDLGNALRRRGFLDEALKSAEKAVSMYRKLVRVKKPGDPKAHLSNLTDSLDSLGRVHRHLGNFDEARKAAKKAKAIRTGLNAPNSVAPKN